MGFFYLGIGLAVIFSDYLKQSIAPSWRYGLGGVISVYGIYRVSVFIKKLRSKND